MAFLGAKFNPNQVEPSQSLEPVPAGEYKLALSQSEIVETKNRDGKYLKCEFVILEGAHKGRKVWANFNCWNKNQVAVEIAWRQLGDLCRACGFYRDLEDSSALHNIPFAAKLSIKKSEGYRDQNEISEYIAKPGPGGQAAPGVTTSPASSPTQAAQPQAAAGGGVPPWLQNA